MCCTLCTSFGFIVFLSGSGAPRDLHSFPTRRSSDLVELCAVLTEPPERTLEGITLDGLDHLKKTMQMHGRVDRKSTRLNSSHANISYAVFCLKKKKQQKTELRYNCQRQIHRTRRLLE